MHDENAWLAMPAVWYAAAMKRALLIFVVACGGSTPAAQTPAPAPAPGSVAETPAPPSTPPVEPAPARSVGHPAIDLISRTVLFGNPERAAVQISPDGKQLSWLAPKDGVQNIWVAP